MKNLHFIQHVPFEGPAYIQKWGEENGYHLSGTHMYRQESLPDISDVDFLVVMGGPMSVKDEKDYPWLTDEKDFLKEYLQTGKPALGICLGAQLFASVFGAEIRQSDDKEIGWYQVEKQNESPLLEGLPDDFTAFHWHGETFELPSGSRLLFSTVSCRNQAFSVGENILGLQFHLESTPETVELLLKNCSGDMVPPGPAIQSAETIRKGEAFFTSCNSYMETILNNLQSRNL